MKAGWAVRQLPRKNARGHKAEGVESKQDRDAGQKAERWRSRATDGATEGEEQEEEDQGGKKG
jgi:hypothetical protein